MIYLENDGQKQKSCLNKFERSRENSPKHKRTNKKENFVPGEYLNSFKLFWHAVKCVRSKDSSDISTK